MQLTSILKEEYESLFSTIKITPDTVDDKWSSRIAYYLNAIQRNQARYKTIQDATGCPWYVVACIHGMEASFNFGSHLHNGDPLSARTVQVPAGRPKTGNPPFTWEESAIDALTYDGVQSIKKWDIATILWFLEGYNGWGYRTGAGQATTPPRRSPYLWSGSTHYVKGKYVADGRFSASAISAQVGVAVIIHGLIQRGLVNLNDDSIGSSVPPSALEDRLKAILDSKAIIGPSSKAHEISTLNEALEKCGYPISSLTTYSRDAVWNFQEDCGLDILDGEAGEITIKNLYEIISVIKAGSDIAAVEALQLKLNKLGYGPVTVTGKYDDLTAKVVKEFQKANSIQQTEKVGSYTWTALQLASDRVSPFPDGYKPPNQPETDLSVVEKWCRIAEVEGRKELIWSPNGEAEKYLKPVRKVLAMPTGRFAWCGAFVTWCVVSAGYTKLPYAFDTGYTAAYVPGWEIWGKNKGYWVSKSSGGERGYIVLFDWQKDGDPDHIGIVLQKLDSKWYLTAEGNTSNENQSNGNRTAIRRRHIDDIRGFIKLPA